MTSIIDFLKHIPWHSISSLYTWNYSAIFLSSILEASPIFGVFVPGQTIITFGGFLARMGSLQLFPLIAIASFGAILGDYIGYGMGAWLGESFLLKYGKYFLFHPKYLEKTKKIMADHAGKAIIMGRFIGVIRSFVPFIAGASGVPFLKFSIFNIVGGILWWSIFVLIGFVFGESYKLILKNGERAIGMIVILVVVILIAKKILSKAEKEL